MEEIIVMRDGQKDLKFKGELLASASDRWIAGREQTRWTEIAVYKTESGKYVIAWESITLWQGELNSYRAKVCEFASETIAELMSDDEEGTAYFSSLAKEVLEELAQSDERFKSLLYEVV